MLVMKHSGITSVAELAAGCSCVCSADANADARDFGGEGFCAAYCGCLGPSSDEDNAEANLGQAYNKADTILV